MGDLKPPLASSSVVHHPRMVLLPSSVLPEEEGATEGNGRKLSGINIISASSKGPTIKKLEDTHTSEEEVKFGLDPKSKARMLHSAKSKALKLSKESKQIEKASLMMPLALEKDLEDLLLQNKDVHLFDRFHKVQVNEWGAIEIISLKEDSKNGATKRGEPEGDEDDLLCREESLQESPTLHKDGPSEAKKRRKNEEVLACTGCGCYGFLGEFLSSTLCSKACDIRVNAKKTRLESRTDKRLRRDTTKKRELEDVSKSVIHTPASSYCNSLVSDGSSETRESSRSTTPSLMERKRIPPHLDYPWFHPKTRDFCWSLYLDCTSSKGAPSKLFRHNISVPPPKNWFSVGMKLEAVDPEHPSLICVVTVAEVQGYRLRLHFDGFPDSYDFWECGNSPNIFPLGWCNRKRLTPPKGYGKKFDWKKYLEETKSIAAPEKLFLNKATLQKNQPSNVDLNEWKVGAKLEAVDRQNTSMVCVATVAEILAGRILIHFDGWEKDYDYWVSPDSPYVHYKGWCDEHGMELNPPNDFPEDEEFDWNVYLKESKTSTVPKSAFKCRQDNSSFKKHMKLEVVDKRNPRLIRVATVVKINGRQIKVHHDGWPDEYDLWFEDDSHDIFPPEWCQKINGSSIENPLTSDEVKLYASQGKCPTPGCRGVGHIKGPIFFEHNSLSTCPYSPQNLDMDDTYLPDRFKIVETKKPSPEEHKGVDPVLNERQSDLQPRIILSDKDELPLVSPVRNVAFLFDKIKGLSDVRAWSSLDVASFVTSLPGLEKSRDIAETILEEEIDGTSFILLEQSDLVKILGLKLGPALKIFHSIQILKTRSEAALCKGVKKEV